MNAEKVDKLIAYMEKVPAELIDMDIWAAKPVNGCGTIACIAGHACLMERKQPRGSWAVTASEILDLNETEKEVLFYQENWPSKHRIRWLALRNREAYKRAVIARLRHFRKTGK